MNTSEIYSFVYLPFTLASIRISFSASISSPALIFILTSSDTQSSVNGVQCGTKTSNDDLSAVKPSGSQSLNLAVCGRLPYAFTLFITLSDTVFSSFGVIFKPLS